MALISAADTAACAAGGTGAGGGGLADGRRGGGVEGAPCALAALEPASESRSASVNGATRREGIGKIIMDSPSRME